MQAQLYLLMHFLYVIFLWNLLLICAVINDIHSFVICNSWSCHICSLAWYKNADLKMHAVQEFLKLCCVLMLLEYWCLIIISLCIVYEFLRNHLRKLVKGDVDILRSKCSADIVFLLRYSRSHPLDLRGIHLVRFFTWV